MYDALLDRWGLPRPRTLTATAWGWNNETLLVASAAGRHILRISANAGRAEVEFEHQLLARLTAMTLPFATPAPVRSAGGGTIELYDGPQGARPATLFKEIPGHHAEDEDTELVAAGATAFGHLDRALAVIDIGGVSRPMATHLARISPAVSTLDGIDAEIGVDAAQLVRAAARDAADLPPTLPTQLIHGDFALGNVLLDGMTVVGILDFEFCGHDLRAMELATALGLVVTKSTGRDLWRPVVAAYLETFPLSGDELRLLPVLTRIGRAAGLLWWIGKQRQGLSSKTDTAERAQRLRDIDTWLAQNGDELVNAALRSARAGDRLR